MCQRKDIKLPIYCLDKDQPAIIKQNLVTHIEMVLYVHLLTSNRSNHRKQK